MCPIDQGAVFPRHVTGIPDCGENRCNYENTHTIGSVCSECISFEFLVIVCLYSGRFVRNEKFTLAWTRAQVFFFWSATFLGHVTRRWGQQVSNSTGKNKVSEECERALHREIENPKPLTIMIGSSLTRLSVN